MAEAKWREAAITFGQQVARKHFAGRTGHGGGKAIYMQIDEGQLAALVALGFEVGAERVDVAGLHAAAKRYRQAWKQLDKTPQSGSREAYEAAAALDAALAKAEGR